MSTILQKKTTSRIVVALIAFAMIFTSLGLSAVPVNAATKKAPTKITLKATAKTVDVKGKVTVSVKSVKPSSASKSVTYRSSNKDVATVNKDGVVTGKKTGTAKITAVSKKSKKVKATITITVKSLVPTGISLNKKKITLNATGDTATLTPTLKPVGVYNKGVKYSSDNTAVATVSSKGVVTAKAPGTAVITAKTSEKGKTTKCTVTVTGDTVLNAWVLTGYYKSTKINNTNVDKNATLKIWNSSTGKFDTAKKTSKNVLGNYVQLVDTDKDKSADLIQVVKYKDGAKFWDADAAWVKGAGEDRSPYPISDEDGEELFSENYRIPSGERLLANWGLGDYSGTTDWANYEDSPYYENSDYSFYNLTSSDSLTMLTGYKTQLQETGSTCVMNSAISVLDWYGVRGDLNSRDLASLRDEDRAGNIGGTSLDELENVFTKLGELGITGRWNMKMWTEEDEKNGSQLLADSDWLKGELAKGHPVMVIWNSYGAHGQVIIGYDDMGTPETNDDVLIMMDPYDTTDHNNDGYIIQSYERLAYGLLTWKNKKTKEIETTSTKFLSVWPKGWDYEATKGSGMRLDKSNKGNVNDVTVDENGSLVGTKGFVEIDGAKIPYGNTSVDLATLYPQEEAYYNTGLSGAAGVERLGDVQYSPYYDMLDVYGTEAEARKSVGSDTLNILDNFKTIQQATEWTCGVTSSLMVLEHFNMNQERKDGSGLETDISLAKHRQNGDTGATYVEGINEIFDYMSSEYGQKWKTFSDVDLVYDEDSECNALGSKLLEDDLIPYLIENNVPMMIGWDEWGGHWQVIVGYDDMGTAKTQDDVLIIADAYDTTDHNQNGYIVQSFERLVYGWNSAFELWNDEEVGGDPDDGYYTFVVAVPDTDEYAKVIAELSK